LKQRCNCCSVSPQFRGSLNYRHVFLLAFVFILVGPISGGLSYSQNVEIPASTDNSLIRAPLSFQLPSGEITTLLFRGVISISREASDSLSPNETRYQLLGAYLEGPQNSAMKLAMPIGVNFFTGQQMPVHMEMQVNGVVYTAGEPVDLIRISPNNDSPLVVNWDLDIPVDIVLNPPSIGDPPIVIVPNPNPNDPDIQVIQLPSFSVDYNTILAPPSASMTFGRGNPPTPGLNVLGALFDDNVDGYCHGERVTDPGRDVIFSVDRISVGQPGSAVNIAAFSAPPHASSSEFASMGIPPGGAITPVNTLVVPYTELTLDPAEDLDALDDSPPQHADPNGDGTPDRPVWFSLQDGGSSIGSGLPESRPAALPVDGILTGDDILAWVPGVGRTIYASGRIDIGLVDGQENPELTDDIDALVIMPINSFNEGNDTLLTPAPTGIPPLNGNGEINMPPAGGPLTWDLAFFSLSRDSASLGGPNSYTAADVFVTNFNGTFMRLHEAADLDLTAEDNVNAMKFMLTEWHGSVGVPTDTTGTSSIDFNIGGTTTTVVIPQTSAGSDAFVADQIVSQLNNSEYFQVRPHARAFSNPFNSTLITLVGVGPCNTQAIPADPALVITAVANPLPFPLVPIAACPNDECPDALPIGPGVTPFDTSCATPSPDAFDPDMCVDLGTVKDDLWYIYTADVCGTLKVSTCPNDGSATFNTDLVAYWGNCTDKVQVACSGDVAGCPGGTSAMEFSVSSGNTYYIRIGGVDDTVNGPGELFLDLIPNFNPGDECSTALPAVLGANYLDTNCATTSTDAYNDAQCPGTFLGDMNQDVWYTYTADMGGLLNVRTCDIINFDSDLVVYRGSCDNLEQIACNGDGNNPATGAACGLFTSAIEDIPIAAGETYFIRAGGFDAQSAGKGILELEYRQPGGGPDPITELTCDADCTESATLNWINGSMYDSINVYVNGALVDSIPGTSTSYTATPITGIRNICLEPVVGSMVGPQTCCTVFGLTPPPIDVACDPIAGTTDVAVSWSNPIAYDSIEVQVGGVFFASLPGTATNVTVTGAGTTEICVRGLLANCWSDFRCCTGGGSGTSPITDMMCDANCTDTATVTWTNGGTYSSINAYVNGTLVDVLPGSSTSYNATPIFGIRSICLEPVVGSVVGPQTCCTAFGLTPSPENIACDPLASTADVFVSWSLPTAYDGIEILVNGVSFASLPGTATSFNVTAGAGREICVRGLIANCWSDPVCCDNTGTPPGVGSINCDPNEPNFEVVVTWSPPIIYDSVEITLNGVVVQTISGTATPFVTVTGVTGTREICVTGIIGGITTVPACCIVTIGSGPPEFIRADTNHDGGVDIADAVRALQELFSGVPSLGCPDANDANDDGGVDIADAIGVLQALFTGGTIPMPFPNCGPDPTPDSLGPCNHAACP